MKKITFLLLLLTAFLPIKAQITDTATWVVNRYLEKLNYYHFPQDTMIYIKSVIVNQNYPTDTVIMKRWFSRPHQYRTEVYDHDTLQFGAYGNGTDYFCAFNHAKKHWDEIHQTAFYEVNQAYDFRGPLYDWKGKAAEFKYCGIKTYNGHPAYHVRVQTPGIFDRDYFFEKESGLFFIYRELTSTLGGEELSMDRHVEWRACHEYIPIGNMITPSVESYLHNGDVIVIRNYPELLPYDYNTFNRD